MDELSRIVAQIRCAWPSTWIVARGDFDKDEIMVWCEAHDVDYVFGCGQNIRLNARYVVTNISRKTLRARGAMENRIKDQQLWRASAHIMRTSMYFLAFAGATLRRVGLRDTACARWRVDTLRSRLFKLAGRVTRTVRRIRRCLASTFPLQDVFARTLVNLRAAAQAPPG